jgi:RNA polymerase sigma-70 factor (ECF subfamily)
MLTHEHALRAFAIFLCGNGDLAEDLLQETYLRALAHQDSFQLGSNMGAWLVTILRNLCRSDYRRRRREVEDADGSYAKTLKTQPNQVGHLEFEEFRAAMDKLRPDYKDVITLVGMHGFPYEDVAVILSCPVGTVKSRLNRARKLLKKHMGLDEDDEYDLSPDSIMQSVVNGK